MNPWEIPTSTLGAGAIVLHRGHVLLVQVNYGPVKGHWISPGGRVERGEKPQETVVREALEETGVEIELKGLAAVRHRNFPDGHANVYFVFLAALKDAGSDFPKLKWPEEEIIEARFWPIEEALRSEVVRPLTRAAIRDAIDPGKRSFEVLNELPGATADDTVFGPR